MRAYLDGAGLRRMMAVRGMTQAELAAAADLTEATVSRAINGHAANLTTVRKLARSVAVTPLLFGGEEIIGSQKEAVIEPPLVTASAGAVANASAR